MIFAQRVVGLVELFGGESSVLQNGSEGGKRGGESSCGGRQIKWDKRWRWAMEKGGRDWCVKARVEREEQD